MLYDKSIRELTKISAVLPYYTDNIYSSFRTVSLRKVNGELISKVHFASWDAGTLFIPSPGYYSQANNLGHISNAAVWIFYPDSYIGMPYMLALLHRVGCRAYDLNVSIDAFGNNFYEGISIEDFQDAGDYVRFKIYRIFRHISSLPYNKYLIDEFKVLKETPITIVAYGVNNALDVDTYGYTVNYRNVHLDLNVEIPEIGFEHYESGSIDYMYTYTNYWVFEKYSSIISPYVYGLAFRPMPDTIAAGTAQLHTAHLGKHRNILAHKLLEYINEQRRLSNVK